MTEKEFELASKIVDCNDDAVVKKKHLICASVEIRWKLTTKNIIQVVT